MLSLMPPDRGKTVKVEELTTTLLMANDLQEITTRKVLVIQDNVKSS
jgi:hypothetical protein